MRFRPVARLALAAAMLACDGTPTTGVPDNGVNIDPAARIASIAVVPLQVTVSRGQTVQLSAQLRDATGATIIGPAVSWSSTNGTIASVNESGLVTAIADGVVSIRAASGGRAAGSVVAVVEVPVASVSLTPTTTTMYVGQEAVISAVTRDALGLPLAGRFVAWTSSDTTVATVSALGVVRGRLAGSATITATSEGQSATAQVAVLNVPVASLQLSATTLNLTIPQSFALTVTPRDAQGNTLTGRTATWESNNTAVVTVSPTGTVTAAGFGTAAVTATVEGVRASASVNVAQAGSPTAGMTPSSATLVTGRTTQLTAALRDANGNLIPGVAFSWTSSNTAVAGVSAQGVVTGLTPGSATVTATAQGLSASANITVVPVPVATVTVSPNPSVVSSGGVAQLSAVARDADGNVLPGRTVTWQTRNSAFATVNGAGVVAGIATGTVEIAATIDGITGTSQLTVLPSPVASVTLSATTISLVPGQSVNVTAMPRDANGFPVSGVAITWQTSAASTVSLSATSGETVTATGGAVGTATIRAAVAGLTADATVNVVAAGDPTPRITPPSAAIVVGQSTTLAAEMVDPSGTPIPGVVFSWSTSNLSVATVTPAGVVTGTGAGTVSITATAQGRSATAQVQVSPVPVASVDVTPASVTLPVSGTQQLAATPRDAGGNALAGRTCTWASANAAVAAVNATTGVLTAVATGSTGIFATCEGVTSASLPVTVTAAPVASVTVTAAVSALQVGQSVSMAATPRDAQGNALTGRAVTWSSSSAAVATVSSTGLVTAVAAGTAEIRATSEGITGSAALTVTPVPVEYVQVAPPTVTLVLGQSTTLTPVTIASNGAVLTGRTVTWASGNAAVATVSASGAVTAVGLGTATITATSEGKSGTSQVTVVPAAVGSVTVTPATVTLESGTTQQLTATVRDASGTILTGRVCTWATNTTVHASVSPTGGLVTAFNPGVATITATCDGVSGSATITVVPAPVATLSLSPATLAITTGQSLTLTATARDARGTVLENRAITWTSSNPAAATVSQEGVVAGVAAGSATITATSEGVSATSAVTVTPPAVATVSIAPASVSLAPGATEQLVATPRDAQGTPITGRTVTWSISDSTVARISVTGFVSAVAVGTAIAVATVDGIQGGVPVSVSAGGGSGAYPIASITLSPTSATLAPGGSQAFSATARTSAGDAIQGPAFTWSSSDPAVLAVDANGVATALTAGTAEVRASSQSVTGSASVTISGTAPLLFKDFEDGSWAPLGEPYGTPTGAHQIITDPANCIGERCYRYTIPSQALYYLFQPWINNGQSYDEIWLRYDLKATNVIRGQLKGIRYADTNAGDLGGMFLQGRSADGASGMGFQFGSGGVQFALGAWLGPRSTQFANFGGTTHVENMSTSGRYHRIVVHYIRNGFSTPRARFWIDGRPVTQPIGPAWANDGYVWGPSQGGAEWISGGPGQPTWLVAATRAMSTRLAQLKIFDQMSATGNSGFLYLDNLTASAQPLQP